jgi:hypothetical protein
MRTFDRLLLRGLKPHMPPDATVLALERGTSDALGEMRKVTAVLTDDSLLLATTVRTKTILTSIPRSDIRSIDTLEPNVVIISFDDFARAIQRVVRLDLHRYGDPSGLVEKLRG